MTSTASSAAHTGAAESRFSEARRRAAALGGAALGAVGVWIGWMSVSPAAGFPRVSPAEMINQTLGTDLRAPLGWAFLLGGLVTLATIYLLAASSGRLRPSLFSGTLFGLALWLATGAVLMPLMGIMSAKRASSAPMAVADPPSFMRETFMMLHLGILAPVGALIAWLVFGGVLSTTSSLILRERRAAG